MPKISALPVATTLGSSDFAPIVQGGVTKSVAKSLLSPTINVKHFGAKGDGATNDTVAIQAALNSVATGQSTATTVFFPSGAYVISAGLTAVGRNVVLQGEGPRSSLLFVSANVTAIALNAIGCSSACVGVENMGISELGTQSTMIAISARNSPDFFLQNVHITTSGQALDVGSSAADVTFSLINQVRIECQGGMPAIRHRSGGGTWSNIYCRKGRNVGVVGPTLWLTGQTTSLNISNCSFGGKGTPRSTQITTITNNGATFDVAATSHGFSVGETFVIRGTGIGYDATWKVSTVPNANTVRVSATTGFATISPPSAFIDKLHTTVYFDNTAGPVNETAWTNVLFEGIDDNGSAGGTGSVSLYVDAIPGTFSMTSHQFSNCMFDCGQTSVYMTGKHVGGGDYLVSDFRFNGCVMRYVKNAFYFKEVRGIIISDYAGDCVRSQGAASELLNSSGVYIDSFGFQPVIGLTITSSVLGRSVTYSLTAISSFSADYGLRVGGNPQDLKLANCHIFGLTGSVLIDSATVLPTNTRLVDVDCTYASGVGGESNATRIPTIASAATVTLPLGDLFTISGTTSITTLNGGWVGRKVELMTTGIVTFTAGATIANSLTTAAGQLVVAVHDGTSWHLR